MSDKPIRPDPLAAAASAMQAVGYALAQRGGPDDVAAARLLLEHATELRRLWWSTPQPITTTPKGTEP